MTIQIAHVRWEPCWRIIPSRFRPIQLFERVTEPDDLEAILELESLTNPRIRDEVGDIRLVPPEDRVTGPGSSIIMAAFTHLNPEGSRFSDGTYGVFYAANHLSTAITESKHHRERFMRATAQAHMELDMRVYVVHLDGNLHDLRNQIPAYPLVYHDNNYAAGQHLAKTLRKDDSDGIAYDSLRWNGGECVAAFRPRVLSNARQERHLCYLWDGQRITTVYEKKALEQ